MAYKKYLDGDGVAQLWQVTKDYADKPNHITDAMLAQTGGVLSAERDLATETITLESGTYADATGLKTARAARVRTATHVPVAQFDSITMPDGYSAWVFCYDRNKVFLRAVNAWQTKIDQSILQDDVVFVNFAIRDTANPNNDLTSLVTTIQSGLQLVTTIDVLRNELLLDLTDKMPKFINGYTQNDGTIKLSNPEFSSHITLENKTDVYGGYLSGSGYVFIVNGTSYSNYCTLPKSKNCIINIRKAANTSDMSVKELDNMVIHIIHEVNERDDDVTVSLSSLSVTSNNVLSPISVCECSFIKTRSHNIAVDFGLTDYQGRIGEYYRKNGIRYCDTLIFSHYHGDHMGAFAAAVSAGYLYIDGATAYLPSDVTTHAGNPEQEITAQRQAEIIGILNSHNCTIVQLTTDQELQLEDNVRLKFYNTDHTVYDSGAHMAMNYNDYSICFELFVNDSFVYNFTADIGPEGQKVMAKKLHKCDVLESPHHGWDNGASNLQKDFILNVYPDAVITANGTEHLPGNGQNSSMDSPYSPMQTWCEKYSVPHYATVLNGDISILVTKSEWRFIEPLTAYVRDATWVEQMGN